MPTVSRQSAPSSIAVVLYHLYGFTYKDAEQSGHCPVQDRMIAVVVVTFAVWLRLQRGSGHEPEMQGA